MIYLFLGLFFNFPVFADDVELHFPKLMSGLLAKQKNPGSFQVHGCPKSQVDWSSVLFQQKTASLKYIHQKNCDIEGEVQIKAFDFAPFSLKLKNLGGLQLISGQSQISLLFNTPPEAVLTMKETVLKSDKNQWKIKATGIFLVDPMGKNKFIKDFKGGELVILEKDGKPINKTISLK